MAITVISKNRVQTVSKLIFCRYCIRCAQNVDKKLICIIGIFMNKKMLANKNHHDRDDRIEFIEDGHVYIVDGADRDYISTTTIIHQFFSEFNADSVIKKMMTSDSWRTSKYHGMTADQIKDQWKEIADTASRLGTNLHRNIESFYNGNSQVNPEQKEFSYFRQFHESHIRDRFIPYRTEWCIFDEESKICGSIDMVCTLSDHDPSSVHIFDWKRSKEIKTENRWSNGKHPFERLPDCNFSHYSLQLNLYKWILEKNYGKRVCGMTIVILHPNKPSFEYIDIPDLSKEIRDMIRLRIASITQ